MLYLWINTASAENYQLFHDDAGDSLLTPAQYDLSIAYLQAIFGNITGSAPTTLLGLMSQTINQFVLNLALMMLGFYSAFYLMNTAVSGQFLGERSDPIVFIRVILGLMLLTMPYNSGYSLAQIWTYKIIKSGVGLADHLWDASLNHLANGGMLFATPTSGTTFSSNSGSGVDKKKYLPLFDAVWKGMFCSYSYDYDIQEGGGYNQDAPSRKSVVQAVTAKGENFPDLGYLAPFNTLLTAPSNLLKYHNDYDTKAWYGPAYYPEDQRICFGDLQIRDAAGNKYTSCSKAAEVDAKTDIRVCGGLVINSSEVSAYDKLIADWTPIVVDLVKKGAASNYSFSTALEDNAIYKDTIKRSILDFEASPPVKNKKGFCSDKNCGWAHAGFYYRSFANDTADAFKYDVTEPSKLKFSPYAATATTAGNSPYQAARQAIMLNEDAVTVSSVDTLSTFAQTAQASGSGAATSYLASTIDNVMKFDGTSDITDPFKSLVDSGHTLMVAGAVLLSVQISLTLLSVLLTSGCYDWLSIGPTAEISLNMILAGMAMAAGFLYTEGAMLAIVLPLIPALIFLAGIVGWFFGVIEGMVAAPIVAFGILWPSGSHPLLSRSEPAIFMLLNLFLRPSLMIMGLLMGLVLFWISIYLLSAAIDFAFGLGIIPVKSILILFPASGLYIAALIATCKKSFSLIFMIPDRIFSWMGAQQASWGEYEDLVQGLESGAQQGAGIVASLGNALLSNRRGREKEKKGKAGQKRDAQGNLVS